MTETLQTFLIYTGSILLALTLYRAWKASQVTDTIVIFKETDSGEYITTQLNFTKSMTEDDRFNRAQKAFELAEKRHSFTDARFKAHLESEENKNASQANVARLK